MVNPESPTAPEVESLMGSMFSYLNQHHGEWDESDVEMLCYSFGIPTCFILMTPDTDRSKIQDFLSAPLE